MGRRHRIVRRADELGDLSGDMAASIGCGCARAAHGGDKHRLKLLFEKGEFLPERGQRVAPKRPDSHTRREADR